MRCSAFLFQTKMLWRCLPGLGCLVEVATEGWTVIPPAYRFDLSIEVDLIEEVVRLYGYNRVPEIPQRAPATLARVTEARVGVDRGAPCADRSRLPGNNQLQLYRCGRTTAVAW